MSVHNYGIYQEVVQEYRSMLFKCSVSGCSFVAPDPIVCSVHMNVLHYQDKGKSLNELYAVIDVESLDVLSH